MNAHALPRCLRALLASLGLLASVACGAPSAAQGTHEGQPFVVEDAAPDVRDQPGRITIVLSDTAAAAPGNETEAEQLWLILLSIPDSLRLETGVEIALGAEGSEAPSLKVAVGDLETEKVGDKTVHNAPDASFVRAESGTLVLWSVDKVLAGEFDAVLAGGGTVKGSFEVEFEQDDREPAPRK